MTRLLSPPTDDRSPVRHRELTDSERAGLAAAFQYARRHDLASPPDEAYRRELMAARWGILARLLGGLARDRPDSLPDPIVTEPTDPVVPTEPAEPLTSLDSDALSARLPDAEGTDRTLLLRFPRTETVVAVPVRSHRAFDRFAFAPPAVACRLDTVEPIETPETVVRLLDREGVVDGFERFRTEIGESVVNLALARLARRVRWTDLAATPTPATGPDPTSVATSEAFDRLVIGGHPFHPGAKLRRGMSPTEVLSFAPEFADSIPVRFAAIHRDRALETSVDDESLTDRLYACFPGLRMAVETAIPSGRSVAEYAVVPVHPWQFRHVLPERYTAAQDAGTVVTIPSYTVDAAPLLSLRTVVPSAPTADGRRPPHLKLAIGVQTTNAVRTLSPNAVTNGPQLTEALTPVCNAADSERFGVLQEPAATCYHPADGPCPDGPDYDDARHLSALLRQHPSTHRIVGDDERVVTAASLLSRPPAGRRSVLTATLDEFADADLGSDRRTVVEAFLSAYLDAVVPGPLELLVTEGVALEAHLQNTSLVFDDGRPTGTLVGDFGGVRVFPDRFGGTDLAPYPDSAVIADDVSAAREKLWYSLFQNHLGELVGRLCATEPVALETCWQLVRERCEQTFDDLAARDDVPSNRVAGDRSSLFDDRLVHKGLTAMRLRDSVHDYCRTRVGNPLTEVRPTSGGGR
ncbi:siderophore synthetase component [Halovivax asiaticus JCM 14624]|uniref:Siderophore synthetase component n=1 Tax=Halovivax asiaticus JCM 14624 TaxID=1227490 RepID=M0BQM9_9EURY|nr:IucA/IucC family protein [Halovivax asiaticus]ELZ12683.1 siderophore synthetase component [Halovivax asiaticus JCM 14624]